MGDSDHGVLDVRTFLSGLRSISLRNLSIRKRLSSGERELPSVTSTNLSNLQAIIYLDEPDSTDPGLASGVSPGGRETVRVNGVAKKALVITGVSQPTINPTWSILETSWLHAGVDTEELEGVRPLRLRVFASSDRLRSSGDVDPVGQMVWETAIDMKTLTALPEGLRLSDLGALPADCLLLEMSKGGLYVPAWVVKALESNSALPKAVIGRGGTGGDAWRDESDSEEGEEQAPLEEERIVGAPVLSPQPCSGVSTEEVLRKVQAIEREAERGRKELAACLKKEGGRERRAFAAMRSEILLESLKQDRYALQGLLKEEEAFLEKEKGHLQAEMQAVEELLKEVSSATDAADADARKLAVERREATKSHVLLEARRARLTAELQAIYPIKYQEKLGAYTIRGLEVPADLYSVDDEKVSSALGYTAHLVCMLAKYLQVPLRYQLIYNASRSAVRDNVTGAGVAYPLFRRGVEKERFDRGVQLLGRDVEQMLIARGVPIKRGTGQILRNLERLMSVEGV